MGVLLPRFSQGGPAPCNWPRAPVGGSGEQRLRGLPGAAEHYYSLRLWVGCAVRYSHNYQDWMVS